MTKNEKKLVENNIGLINYTLAKYYPQLLHDEDVQQTASIGLCKAAKNYDQERGSFSNYAVIKIRGEVFAYLRKLNNDVTKWYKTVSFNQTYGKNTNTRTLTEMIPNMDYTNLNFEIDYYEFNNWLTDRERITLSLLKKGYTYRQISAIMGLSKNGVQKQTKSIKRKFKAYCKQEGLLL